MAKWNGIDVADNKLSYKAWDGDVDYDICHKTEMRVWIGVLEGVYPSPPINRRMTVSFTTADVVGTCSEGWVFDYNGLWVVPSDEECFIEVHHYFTGTERAGKSKPGLRWIPKVTHERYTGILLPTWRKTPLNSPPKPKDEFIGHKADPEPTKPAPKAEPMPKATPKPAKPAPKPVKPTPKQKTSAPKPVEGRRRGRPKGSKDSRPRVRRTKAEMAASAAPRAQKQPKRASNGLIESDYVAWIQREDGLWDWYPIWFGEDDMMVEIRSDYIPLPKGTIVGPRKSNLPWLEPSRRPIM